MAIGRTTGVDFFFFLLKTLTCREGAPPLSLHEQQNKSLYAAGAILAKAILGVGVLALPKLASVLGIGTTLIFLVFVAFLSYLSLHNCTVASSRTGYTRYSDVVRDYTGVVGQSILDLALAVNSAGVQVIALIVIGDILVGHHAHEGLLSAACGDRQTVLIVVSVILIAPLVSVTRLRSLTGASTLGVTAVVGFSLLTVLLFIIAATNGQIHSMTFWPTGKFVNHGFQSAVQVIATLPVLLFAFICQMSLQGVLRDLQYVQEQQVDKITSTALVIATVCYAAIGVFCYGLFGGKDIDPDVLRNFTVDALQPLLSRKLAQATFVAVRIGFLISLLGIFPMHMAPLRDSIWKLLFRTELAGPGLWLVTYLLLGGVYLAAAWLPSIWEPLVLIGSTAGVLIALIFPGILAMRTPELLTEPVGAHYWRQMGGGVLIFVGLVIGLFGVLRVVFYKTPFEE